ncbi:MAG: response regulator, partial [Actinomycetales bacterium]
MRAGPARVGRAHPAPADTVVAGTRGGRQPRRRRRVGGLAHPRPPGPRGGRAVGRHGGRVRGRRRGRLPARGPGRRPPYRSLDRVAPGRARLAGPRAHVPRRPLARRSLNVLAGRDGGQRGDRAGLLPHHARDRRAAGAQPAAAHQPARRGDRGDLLHVRGAPRHALGAHAAAVVRHRRPRRARDAGRVGLAAGDLGRHRGDRRGVLLDAAAQLRLPHAGRQAVRGPAGARAAGARAQRQRAPGARRREDGARPRPARARAAGAVDVDRLGEQDDHRAARQRPPLDAAAAQHAGDRHPGPRGEPPVTAPRVVLVDDTEDLRNLMRIALKRVGWEVVGEAGDGAAGIEVATAEDPDLVVLDLSMPVMDGLEALPHIRSSCPDATIVV